MKAGQPCHPSPIFPPRPPEESLPFPSPCPPSWWGPRCSDQTQWHLPLIRGDGGSASIASGEINYGPMPDIPVPWVTLCPSPPPPIHKTNHFLSHTQCSQPPLLALGQAPSVLTNPLPPAPSAASHDDEIVSLAAYDAEMQKEQERRRSDHSVSSGAALLFLHRWLIGQHVWTASQTSSHRAGRTNGKLSFNSVPWARAPGTVPHPGRGGLSPPPCLGGQGWVPLRCLCTGGGIICLRAWSWWHPAHIGWEPFLQACPQGTLSPKA